MFSFSNFLAYNPIEVDAHSIVWVCYLRTLVPGQVVLSAQMKIDSDKNLLVLEVDRQLKILSEKTPGTDDRPAKQNIILLSEEGNGYRNCLSRLRTLILDWPGT